MEVRSFEAKVNLGIYITLALFIPVIAFAAYSIHFIVSEQRDLIQARGGQLILAERLRSELRTQFALMPLFVLKPTEKLVGHMNESHERFKTILTDLQNGAPEEKKDEAIIAIGAQEAALFHLGQPMIQKRLEGLSVEEAGEFFEKTAGRSAEKLTNQMDQVVEKKTAELEETKLQVFESVSNLLKILGAFTIVCVTLAGAIAVLMTKLTRQKRQLDSQTETRLSEQEHYARARKEILEVVSHDLKNPLSTMKMATEILEEELSTDHFDRTELRETIEIANRSISSMDRLIKDLLDNTKIESGHFTLDYSSARLHALTRQLSDPLKHLAKAKGIELVTVFDTDDADVKCDRDRVAQVFSNLIGNAIKFTPQNGKIWITAQQERDEAVISIRDSGSGIPGDQLPHIFDRFWQVRETASQGTGLGLAIVKGIIDAHGTRIWAESEVGHGAKFSFTLPLQN